MADVIGAEPLRYSDDRRHHFRLDDRTRQNTITKTATTTRKTTTIVERDDQHRNLAPTTTSYLPNRLPFSSSSSSSSLPKRREAKRNRRLVAIVNNRIVLSSESATLLSPSASSSSSSSSPSLPPPNNTFPMPQPPLMRLLSCIAFVIFFLTQYYASASPLLPSPKSVALLLRYDYENRSSSSPLFDSSAHPFDLLLALNWSRAHHSSREDIERLLHTLDEHDDEDEDDEQHQNINDVDDHKENRHKHKYSGDYDGHANEKRYAQHRRHKREVTTLTQNVPQDYHASKPRKCAPLRNCGRIFINAFKFLHPNNYKQMHIKDNDLLITQCTLRTAFFNCLKITQCKRAKQLLQLHRQQDASGAKRAPNPKANKRVSKFNTNLSNTIWESRLCIFRDIIQVPDFDGSKKVSSSNSNNNKFEQ